MFAVFVVSWRWKFCHNWFFSLYLNFILHLGFQSDALLFITTSLEHSREQSKVLRLNKWWQKLNHSFGKVVVPCFQTSCSTVCPCRLWKQQFVLKECDRSRQVVGSSKWGVNLLWPRHARRDVHLQGRFSGPDGVGEIVENALVIKQHII